MKTVGDDETPQATSYVERQTEVGSMPIQCIDVSVLIISFGWPSWAFGLLGLGFESIGVKLMGVSLSTKLELEHTVVGNLILETTVDDWILAYNNKRKLLCVQGQVDDLRSLYAKFQCLQSLPTIFISSDINYYCAECFRINHASVGGVTKGEWSVWTKDFALTRPPPSCVQRTLKHVINVMETAHPRDSESDHEVYELNSCIPYGTKNLRVHVKSIFSGDRFIKRRLTLKEIMEAYDLDLALQQALNQYWSKEDCSPSYSFIKQPPLKVMRVLGLAVAGQLGNANDSTRSICYDSDHTLTMSNQKEDVLRRHLIDPSLEELSLIGEDELEPSDESQVLAARPDDAEAEISEWDEWTVRSFQASTGCRPLVCQVPFSEATHSPLFAALRNILIRIYRRNVFRSFIKHLRDDFQTSPVNISNNRDLRRSDDLKRMLEVGRDVITRTANSTWWEWSHGSTLIYWRWPRQCWKRVRDGTPLFIV